MLDNGSNCGMVVLDHFNSSVFSVLHRVFFIRNDYEKRGGKIHLEQQGFFFLLFYVFQNAEPVVSV